MLCCPKFPLVLFFWGGGHVQIHYSVPLSKCFVFLSVNHLCQFLICWGHHLFPSINNSSLSFSLSLIFLHLQIWIGICFLVFIFALLCDVSLISLFVSWPLLSSSFLSLETKEMEITNVYLYIVSHLGG